MKDEKKASGIGEEEFNQKIDEWVIERNKSVGEISIPQLGLFPPDLRIGLHGALNNELVTADLIRHYAYAITGLDPR